MKRFNGSMLLVLWLAVISEGLAQMTNSIKPDNIIVLVDVSGSMKRLGLADSSKAGRLVYNIIQKGMTGLPSFEFKPQGGMEKEGGLERRWTEASKKLLVVPYGDIATDVRVSGQVTATSLTDDLGMLETALLEKWPTGFVDQYSYQNLARYRAAELAKREGFTSYWLFVVSDGIHEQQGETEYSPDQQELLQKFQPKDIEGLKLGTIRNVDNMGKARSNFRVDISYVDLAGVDPPSPVVPGDTSKAPPLPPPPAVIHITKKGKKDEPVQFERTLTWTCSGTSVDSFVVFVSGVNGTKLKPGANKYSVKGSNSISLPLDEGTYRITVEGTGAMSDTTYVRVGSGDWSWLWWLLVAALVLGVGFWFWGKKRKGDQPGSRPPKPGPVDTGSSDLDL